ncbi:hypothetical protein QZH56_20990 [Streptomyces olivoreticuli]|uniref:hypothetical protein n=1 Tax=Streptomyces olivoreticuli TaxID=68246 RepID=UPI0026583FC0|nr:hypothetical protein [Streptomyces olivoreticuli]WKK21338.1 hypothetical protein QZH56_20990 [Streptomyces olivoreticuli]
MSAPGTATRMLPTDRMQVTAQIRVLQSLAELSGNDAQEVRSADLARHMGRYADSVTEAVSYLASTGLAEGGRGRYRATRAGREFAALWDTDSARARLLLRDLYHDHWAARQATRILADGLLPQEEVAARLQQGLPGKRRRGIYLVEWLVIALVVHRDKRLHLSLPGPDGPGPDQDGHAPGSDAPGPAAAADGGAARTGRMLIMGLSMDQLREMPDEQYAEILHGLAHSINALNTAPA